ncbi:hypothetical protein DYU11_14805 [Fibrisoma montanum]|uniref:Glycosyltransferase n=1 Tax=Fibrisoma montanum TaxID=2305895 RepID=A0A418M834_9BACT|nr:hypothetical protein [Fibrisoma montanum]RIV22290.1 hypothetical protein DYU11_14805 [Fibrisoma montanum]
MKILMLSSSYPPDACGGGDYVFILVSHLQQLGIDVEVFHNFAWKNNAKVFDFFQARKERDFDIAHWQYPTANFGFSLIPHINSILKRNIITLHEVSYAHPLHQASYLPFSFTEDLIFTTSFEVDYFKRLFPWRKNHLHIIPIGSNIPKAPSSLNRQSDILYFGLITPRKGVEKVIDLAQQLKNDGSQTISRVVISGRVPEGYEDYYKELQHRSENLPVLWEMDLSAEAVSLRMARAAVAYFPYPDGASDRRGSLKATLLNGLPTISTVGKATNNELKNVLIPAAETPSDVLRQIETLVQDNIAWKQLAERSVTYASQFDWTEIARQHIQVYEDHLRRYPKH